MYSYNSIWLSLNKLNYEENKLELSFNYYQYDASVHITYLNGCFKQTTAHRHQLALWSFFITVQLALARYNDNISLENRRFIQYLTNEFRNCLTYFQTTLNAQPGDPTLIYQNVPWYASLNSVTVSFAE